MFRIMPQKLNNLGKKKRKEIMTFSKEKGVDEWSKSPFWAIIDSVLRYLKSIKHVGYSKTIPCIFFEDTYLLCIRGFLYLLLSNLTHFLHKINLVLECVCLLLTPGYITNLLTENDNMWRYV